MSLSKFDMSHLLRGDMVRRMTAFVLVCVMAFSLAKPMEAKAVVVDGTSAVALGTAAAKVWLTSTGTTLTVLGGGANAGTAAISTAASAYATATGAAASGDAFLSAVGAGASVSGGSLVLTAAAVVLLAGFAYWCYQEYINETPSLPGESDPVYSCNIGDLDIAVVKGLNGSGPYYDFYSLGTPFTEPGQSVKLGENLHLLYFDNYSSGSNMFARFHLVNDDGTRYKYNGYPICIAGRVSIQDALPVDSHYPIMFGWNTTYKTSGDHYVRMVMYDPAYTAYYFTKSYTSTKEQVFYGLPLSTIANILSVNESTLRDDMPGYKYSSETGYTSLPVPNENQVLEFENIVSAETTPETFPSIIGDSLANGSLTPPAPVIKQDFDSPVGSGDGEVITPETPPADVPFLPDSLTVPWHYVVQTIKNSAEFIGLFAVVISNLLPSSMQAVIWAAVVLLVLFGLIRRFLQ